jgi:integrase
MSTNTEEEAKTLSTDRDIKNIREDGKYRITGKPTTGLYLSVKDDGGNKFWSKRYRFGGKRREIGFGTYPVVSLADAVVKAMDAERDLLAGNDPLELRAEQKSEQRRLRQKQKTFKAMADDFINNRSRLAPKPWKPSTERDVRSMVAKQFAPLHKYLCSEITVKQVFDVVNPMRAKTPSMADSALKRLRMIFDWAYANEAMDGKMNPADLKRNGALQILFGTNNITPDHTPRHAINWRKVPALMAKLNELAQPRTRYNVKEAATAIGETAVTIYNAAKSGKLKVYRPEKVSGLTHGNTLEIEPADLREFARATGKKIIDVTPGAPPLAVLLLKFLILNWSRFDEVHGMVWSEWQRQGNLLVIPWQRVKGRNKAGARTIKIDHVVPLNYRSVEILTMLDEQRKRDNNDSEFVFGNYRAANGSERMGQPICDTTINNLLKRLLPPEEVKAVLHGMRSAGRTWGNVQRRMGYLKVVEEDLERALAHVKGYGKTPLVRIYSRDDEEIEPLIPIFDGWADFANSDTPASADVIPIRRRMKQGG